MIVDGPCMGDDSVFGSECVEEATDLLWKHQLVLQCGFFASYNYIQFYYVILMLGIAVG
jgi:hypothetical protein